MQTADFTAILERLQAGSHLSCEQMRQVIGWFLSGSAEIAAMQEFLVRLESKGETVDELVGAAQALRESMLVVPTTRTPLLDTCGTGGDGAKTFNISTAAALAIAATGVAVAKHGNRRITSSTGSADVLAELGINLEATPQIVGRCLEQLGICFCFAPHFHPAMRYVGPARRQIPHPTIFNRLGPLANPARADHQVLGVGTAALQRPLAEALQRLGTTRSLVVRGDDGVDEVSLSSETTVLEVSADHIQTHTWQPEDFGVDRADRAELYADDPPSSAACIRDVFSGGKGPRRDVVVINAAAGLWISGFSGQLRECAARVEQAIDSGEARQLVEQLAELSNTAVQ